MRLLCDGVREVIHELFPEDRLYLAFLENTNGNIRAPDWSSNAADAWTEHTPAASSAMATVIAEGQPLLGLADPDHPGQGLKSWPEASQYNWLGVPIVARNGILGALVVEGGSENTQYREPDRDLLQFVATQLATVLERKKAEEQLRFMAHHDPLTGLTNRSLFYDRLESALRSASRNQSCLALLYLDLNEFKRINDTLGHDAGDAVLREVARRLEMGTRQTDTIGRMGGDEFTVLLTDLPDSAVALETAVNKIRELLASPISACGQTVSITASIGIAVYPDDGETVKQLMIKADANMYLRKHASP